MSDTVIDPGVASAPPSAEPPRHRFTLSFGAAAVLSMLGTLLVTVAYAFGRADIRFGVALWWVAQLLVYVPLFWHVVSTKWGVQPRWSLVALLLGVESYMIKWLYSPTQLRFIDEFQHLRGMLNSLDTGHIAAQNQSLPISQYFPGLQSISASFSDITGLSPIAVGLVLSGVAHVLITLLVFELFRSIFASGRAGAVAGLLYCTNSSFTFFNSYFVYETFAVPFMLLTMILIVRLRASTAYRVQLGFGVFGAYLATLALHHVTVFFLAIFVVLVLIDIVVRRQLRKQSALVWSCLASLTATAAYMVLIRDQIGNYFKPYTTDVLSPGTRPIFEPRNGFRINASKIPRFDQVVTYIGFGLLTLAMLWGLFLLLRFRNPWTIPFGGLAALFAISLPAGRLLPFGGQIYGRASTFVYLGVGFVFVVAMANLPTKLQRRVRSTSTTIFIFAVASGLTVAVPAFWFRLPGNFYPKGYESGFDSRIAAASSWVGRTFPPRQKFMTDANGNAVLNTLSNQEVLHQGDQLFYLDSLSPDGYKLISGFQIQYAWIDSRLASVRSPSARYFYGSSNGYFQAPPTVQQLQKFSRDSNLSRLYDDGDIQIYDLTGIKR